MGSRLLTTALCRVNAVLRQGRLTSTAASVGNVARAATPSNLCGHTTYEWEHDHFRIEKPEYFNFTQTIEYWARREAMGDRGDTPAFWWVGDGAREVKWNFRELLDKSKRVANVLQGACGLRKGDRVLVMLPRIPAWWLIKLACLRAGLVLLPSTTLLTSKDLEFRFQASQAACVITTPDCAETVDAAADGPDLKMKILVAANSDTNTPTGWLDFKQLVNDASPEHVACRTKSDDPAMWYFTSGTTGLPKMTEHTHASYGLGMVNTARYAYDCVPTNVFWCLSDTGWVKAAYGCFFGPWIAGCCVFVSHVVGAFDTKHTLGILKKYPIDLACFPPTAFRMMIREDVTPADLGQVQDILCAGEPINPEIIYRWKEVSGLWIREVYGQTETSALCGNMKFIDLKPGSMGKPVPPYTLDIVDDTGTPVGPNTEGDIGVKLRPHRPVGLFTRYVNEPERTAACVKGDYYLTGDRAMRDDDGYFWFISRSDDVLISAGYRIGPFEIESALLGHPAVVESAAVSSPDPIRGQVVKAFIVLGEQYESADKETLAAELKNFVKETTAPYKYPRKIEFVKDLPKTISGKIKRIDLRKSEWSKEN